MSLKSSIWGFFLTGVLAGAISFFVFNSGNAKATETGIFQITKVQGAERRSLIVKLIEPLRPTHKIAVQWTYLSDTKLRVIAEPKNQGQ